MSDLYDDDAWFAARNAILAGPFSSASDAATAVLDAVAPAIAARAQAQAVVDLADRLKRARDVLNGRARDAEGFERFRLDGKANGVALALSYVEEITRASRTP